MVAPGPRSAIRPSATKLVFVANMDQAWSIQIAALGESRNKLHRCKLTYRCLERALECVRNLISVVFVVEKPLIHSALLDPGDQTVEDVEPGKWRWRLAPAVADVECMRENQSIDRNVSTRQCHSAVTRRWTNASTPRMASSASTSPARNLCAASDPRKVASKWARVSPRTNV